MAEITKNFLKGRMNKDLDDRIVPQGEYRDALNVQSSTSEESSVGAIQNLLGNENVFGYDKDGNRTNILNTGQTVGSIVDNANNCIYSMVANAGVSLRDINGFTTNTPSYDIDDTRPNVTATHTIESGFYEGLGIDAIYKLDPDDTVNQVLTQCVLRDVYKVASVFFGADDSSSTNPNKEIYLPEGVADSVRVGMQVNVVTGQGIQQWVNDGVILVTGVFTNHVTVSKIPSEISFLTSTSVPSVIGDKISIVFSADRVLNFSTSTELENTNEDYGSTGSNFVSPTPSSNLITGINLLESKYLFFTDGFDEPKKINVYRSLQGTDQTLNLQKHTRLLVTDKSSGLYVDAGPLEKSHITVIKPHPKHVLNFRATKSDDGDIDFTEAFRYQPGGFRMTLIPTTELSLWETKFTSSASAGGLGLPASDFNLAISEFVSNVFLDGNSHQGLQAIDKRFMNLISLNSLDNMVSRIVASATTEQYYTGLWGFNGWGSSTPSSDDVGSGGGSNGLDQQALDSALNGLTPTATAPSGFVYFNTLQQKQDLLSDFPLNDFLSSSNGSVPLNPYHPLNFQLTDGYPSSVGFTPEEIIGIKQGIPSQFAANPQPGIFGNATPTDNNGNAYLRSHFFVNKNINDQSGYGISSFSTPVYTSGSDNFNYATSGNQGGTPPFANFYPTGTFSSFNQQTFASNTPGAPDVPNPAWENPLRVWGAGDVIIFREPQSDNTFTVKIFEPPINMQDNVGVCQMVFEILEINIVDQVAAAQPRRFYGFVDDGNAINSQDFYRISYRYEYEDGEVSPIGPYTQPIFKALPLNLNSSGENEGMRNQVRAVEVFDFVNDELPKDVVGIDIIYKRDGDQNYYEVLKLNNSSYGWNVAGSTPGLKGYAKISKEYFGRVLSLDQSLRHWDNVPQKALAQEIIGNRLVFGNYTEGFDLIDAAGQIINPDISVSTRRFRNAGFNRPELSVKANRTYNVGVVYIDEFGREAPVLTSNNASVTVPKAEGSFGTRLQVEIHHNAPHWATHYKIFVKEPSQPHSNITLLGAEVQGLGSGGFSNEITFKVGLAQKDNFNEGNEIILLNGPSQKRYQIIRKSVGTAIGAYFGAPPNNESSYAYFTIAGDGVLEAQLGIEVSNPGVSSLPEMAAANVFINNWANAFNLHKLSFQAEVVADNKSDLDLWWESSGAIPIRLTSKNVKDYIKLNQPCLKRIAQQKTLASNSNLTKNGNAVQQLLVTNIEAQETSNADDSIVVTFNDECELVNLGNYSTHIGFIDPASGFCFRLKAKLPIAAGDTSVELHNTTHPTPSNDRATSVIDLHFVNSVSQSQFVPLQTARMRDSLSGQAIGKGVKASTISQDYTKNNKTNGFIWSGLYNSGSNFNELNQFNVGLPITKDISPRFGSIQKLYAKDTNLTAFCEDKVLNILANKDALFNADGSTNITASNAVLGQATPYVGEYGISKNPESFSVYGYRSYFVDSARGSVMRLSRDGLTPISEAGMKKWFIDNTQNSSSIIGSYDERKQEYNVTLHNRDIIGKKAYTVSYSESSKGWVSFKSYTPEAQGVSLNSEYYTFMNGNAWRHHTEKDAFDNDIPFNNFYGQQYKSTITAIFNQNPASSKEFKTLFYDGDLGWAVLGNIQTDSDEGHIGNTFKRVNNKHYDYIKGGDKYKNILEEWQNMTDFSQNASGVIDFSTKNVYGTGAIEQINLIEGETDLPTFTSQFYIISTASGATVTSTSSNPAVQYNP